VKVLVTVKAYPGLGHTDGEAACVAGVRLDTATPECVRLWPVGFRELPGSARFKKWQIIDLDATKSTRDRRPESHTPVLSSLEPGPVVPSGKGWKRRRELLGSLVGETTLCDLLTPSRYPSPPASSNPASG